MGRQPWVVFGLLTTSRAVSPSVSALSVGISLVAFVLVYGLLAAITVWLMARTVTAARTSGAEPAQEGGLIPELSLATAY